MKKLIIACAVLSSLTGCAKQYATPSDWIQGGILGDETVMSYQEKQQYENGWGKYTSDDMFIDTYIYEMDSTFKISNGCRNSSFCKKGYNDRVKELQPKIDAKLKERHDKSYAAGYQKNVSDKDFLYNYEMIGNILSDCDTESTFEGKARCEGYNARYNSESIQALVKARKVEADKRAAAEAARRAKAAKLAKVEKAKREKARKAQEEKEWKAKMAIYNIDYSYSQAQVERLYRNLNQWCDENRTEYANGSFHVQLVCKTGYYDKPVYYYFDNGVMTTIQR